MDPGDLRALEFIELRAAGAGGRSVIHMVRSIVPLGCATCRLRTFAETGAMEEVDPRLAEGVALFNQREFFACHDVLEEVWSETLDDREFFQGLIHAAVALFHFGEGNLGGARKMAASTLRYLQQFRPVCRGVDVERLMDDFERCFAELLGPHASYPAGLTLDEARIPVIQLRDA